MASSGLDATPRRSHAESLISEDSIVLSPPPPLASALSHNSAERPSPTRSRSLAAATHDQQLDDAVQGGRGKTLAETHLIADSDTDRRLKDSRRSRRTAHIWSHWWREIIACIVFLAALLALFSTLFAYMDKPSPNWPTWISLNTIVAIYVVILKASILLVTAEGIGQLKWSWFSRDVRPLEDLVKFDDATRGPYGAGVLLWRLRTDHLLSSLGAIIIILGLAADPFAQQIVHYQDCPVNTTRSSYIPRTNVFSSPGLTSKHTTLYVDYQSIFLEGMYSANHLPPVSCWTGNCTWPEEYSTLGWCSECHDVSGSMTFHNETYQFRKYNRTHDSWRYNSRIPGISYNAGGYTTKYPDFTTSWPFGEHYIPVKEEYAAMRGLGPSQLGTGFTPAAATIYIEFLLTKCPFGALNPLSGEPWSFCNNTDMVNTWPCHGYGASRCKVSPCVKTFSASFKLGSFGERLLSTSTNWGHYEGAGWAMLDTNCLNAEERRNLMASGQLTANHTRWYPWNHKAFPDRGWHYQLPSLPLSPNATMSDRLLARGCLYLVDRVSAANIADYFAGYFNGTIKSLPVWENAMSSIPPGWENHSPIAVQTVFNNGNVTFDRVSETFDNVTTALTNYWRSNGREGFSTPALGVAQVDKVCISVQWPWLAFPTVLVLLTLLFFGLLIWETRPTGTRPQIWKSSPLPLLYHGLHNPRQNSDEQLDNVSHIRVMEAMAKGTTVKLEDAFGETTHLEVQSKAHARSSSADS